MVSRNDSKIECFLRYLWTHHHSGIISEIIGAYIVDRIREIYVGIITRNNWCYNLSFGAKMCGYNDETMQA